MERQVSNFLDKSLNPFFIVFCSFFLLGGFHAILNLDEYVKGKLYTIDTIKVSGIKTFSDQTVISYSQLRKGQKINIPGDEISSVINKLWSLQLFSDINFYINHIEEDRVALEIEIEELPSLKKVKINGLKKTKIEPILKKLNSKPEKSFQRAF